MSRQASIHQGNRSQGISHGAVWEHESPFLEVDYEERSTKGTPTLKHLALKKTLFDQRSIDESHLQYVPWKIAKEIWDYLTRSGKRTLYMWKVFCACYPEEFQKVAPFFRKAVASPRFQMRQYLKVVRSTNCHWATHLIFWTEHASTPELVEVADVTNLVGLEIYAGNTAAYQEDDTKRVSDFDDRIFRTWAELVDTAGAFSHLKMLTLHGQQNVSKSVFRYLSRFPSLEVCLVVNCDHLTSESALVVAEAHGWQAVTETPGNDGHNRSDRISEEDMNYPFEKKCGDQVPGKHLIPSSLPAGIPLLEFRVGKKQRTLCRSPRVCTFLRKSKKRIHEDSPPPKRDRKARKFREPKGRRDKDLPGFLGEFM